MKKISVFLVLTLLFNFIAPLSIFAESNEYQGVIKEDEIDREKEGNVDKNKITNDDVVEDPENEIISKTEESSTTDIENKEEKSTAPQKPNTVKEELENKETTDTSLPLKDNKIETTEDQAATNEVEKVKEQNIEKEAQLNQEDSVQLKVMANQKTVNEKSTDKLSQIITKGAKIHKDINNLASFFHASEEYLEKVYYVKKKAYTEGNVYYLLSKEPSSTRGVIGWIKKSDVTWHSRDIVDWETKTFYATGEGKGYRLAWGGNKDIKLDDLSKYKGEKFTTEVTVQVGEELWYRGEIGGTTIWVHMNQIASLVEKDTDKLAHIDNHNALIYREIGNSATSYKSGDKLLGKVYYVKKKASAGGVVYYLLSKEASSTSGIVGWIKKTDVTWHSREIVDWDKQTFYLEGSGKGYKRAWGGNKEIKLNDLSEYKGDLFTSTVTLKVGKQLWYRGKVNDTTVWIHSDHVTLVNMKDTDKLAHINNSSALIYREIGNPSTTFKSGEDRINKVFYVKKKASINGTVYYLLSKKASSTHGVVGWIKKSDVTWHSRDIVDWETKTFYATGEGKGYSLAWGGNKDIKLDDLSKYKGEKFTTEVTVQVGKELWYRGKIGGTTIWVHKNQIASLVKKDTDKLAHIDDRGALIYGEIGDSSTTNEAGDELLGKVYYVKKKASAGGVVYYLLSEKASSTSGIVGWIKKSDVTWQSRKIVDWDQKTFYAEGTGKGYSSAWGGSKEIKLASLASYKGYPFEIEVTVQVGNQLWYRGVLGKNTVWIEDSHLAKSTNKVSKYNITLEEALNIQMKASPQTDRYPRYVSSDYVVYNKSNGNYYVTASVLNVREGAGVDYDVVDQVRKGQKLSVKRKVNGWYQLYWVDAKAEDVLYYLDPNNFINDPQQKFQFLDLSKSSGASTEVLNNYLQDKGILSNQGKAFVDAGNKHGINDVYLISHALLETGNGSSSLAKGVKYNGVTVYNMYGVGAYDSCPIDCGAKKAYDEGWTTPYKAIVGGASFIGNEYIKGNNKENRKLDTLYKMRWNPGAMEETKAYGKQYATDIGWASKQIYRMYDLYQQLDSYTLYLDIPEFK
ncbi:N-acetylglucosaminidase [Virgibacillus halodenitrificans]|uniref:N-acetylglucosaminidase n=1 Tax=Virgibacillus halodenitrificans TaxID=1482 RepID=UPI00045CBC87|nr:N-acetylglucosaminidase [Virgibacillus halodenitrificans]CDQ31482.1 Beta-N-acetylglucosaminidase precursor [Virgibacillus halodenitrificans]